MKKIVSMLLIMSLSLTCLVVPYARAATNVPADQIVRKEMREYDDFKTIEKQLKREGIHLGQANETEYPDGKIVTFDTGNPDVPYVISVMNTRESRIVDVMTYRKVAENKIQIDGYISGNQKVIDLAEVASPDGVQIRVVPGLVWIAIGTVEWLMLNWCLVESLSNGDTLYNVYATIGVGLLWWLVDQNGDKVDERTDLQYTYDKYQYGYTESPDGTITYH